MHRFQIREEPLDRPPTEHIGGWPERGLQGRGDVDGRPRRGRRDVQMNVHVAVHGAGLETGSHHHAGQRMRHLRRSSGGVPPPSPS